MALLPLVLGALGLGSFAWGYKNRPSYLRTHPLSNYKPSPNAQPGLPFPDGYPDNIEILPPPPPADGAPPADVLTSPEYTIYFDPTTAAVGQPTPVMFVNADDEGGATIAPIAWLSPDKSKGAILWVQHPAYGVNNHTVGKMYWAFVGRPDMFRDDMRADALAKRVK